MCTCKCVHICICVYMYVCLCVHICLPVCACVYTYVSACVCACTYICVYLAVCVHVCLCVCIYILCMCIHMWLPVCTCVCVCACVFTDLLASLVEGFRNLISGLALALWGRSLVPLLMPGVSPRPCGQTLHLIHFRALTCLARASHKLSISLVLEGLRRRPPTVGTGANEHP